MLVGDLASKVLNNSVNATVQRFVPNARFVKMVLLGLVRTIFAGLALSFCNRGRHKLCASTAAWLIFAYRDPVVNGILIFAKFFIARLAFAGSRWLSKPKEVINKLFPATATLHCIAFCVAVDVLVCKCAQGAFDAGA